MAQEKNQQFGTGVVGNIASVVTNKRSRSLVFLIITFTLILIANGLMPLISGQVKYTAEMREMEYKDYIVMHEENELYSLTYSSLHDIEEYKKEVIKRNPDLTAEEVIMITPPDNMKVTVYTKFFFESPWWYLDTGLSMASSVFLFFALFNFLNVKAKDTRIEHVNGESTMKQLNENYLDPYTFETWIDDDFNKQRKIKQHMRNTKHDLKKLEENTPYFIRKRFLNYFKTFDGYDERSLLPVVYDPLTPQEKKYMEKKEELLERLTEQYINDVVVDNKVKHFKSIKAGFVYSGVNNKSVIQDEYSTIYTDAQRIKSTASTKILLSLALTLSFASILTVLSVNMVAQSPLWIVMTVIMKILPLALQIYFAIDYTNWFMEQQLLPNLKFRQNIAMLYLAEMKRQGVITEPIVINQINLTDKK